MKRIALLIIPTLICGVVFLSCGSDKDDPQNEKTNDGYVNAFKAKRTVWSYLYGEGEKSPKLYQVILHGDTIIDNTTWKIITDEYFLPAGSKVLLRTYESKIKVRSYPGLPFYGSSPFWGDLSLNEEVTIYDFSLKIGDSLITTLYPPDFASGVIKYKILDIDSIVLNDGKKHKRMKFSRAGDSSIDEYLIEGVGFADGWFTHPLGMFIELLVGIPLYPPKVVCCEVDGELLYRNPMFADCDGNLSQ